MKRLSQKVERDRMNREKVFRFGPKRRFLKYASFSQLLEEDERSNLADLLDRLPRGSSGTRVRNYCLFTGRPRSVSRFFRLSRHSIKQYSLLGELYGIQKASW